MAYSPTQDLLVGSYRVRANYERFEPIAIGGFPAVLQQTTPSSSHCTVTIGVAVGQAVDVGADDFSAAGPSDPCALGVRVSDAVLANLPAPTAK